MVFQEAEYILKFNFWGRIFSIANSNRFKRFIEV